MTLGLKRKEIYNRFINKRSENKNKEEKSMKKKTISVLLSAMMAAGCLVVPAAASESKSVEDLLLEPYEETVDIHVVLQYRESEDPLTPTDCTPETSTAVKKLKEDLNINLIYDWIVNADQYDEKFGARRIYGRPERF